jgi:arylsulfatase A-like enzyme
MRTNRVLPPAPSNKPNILLIVLDTVRADHMSLYGYERDTTPWLRNFAKESLVFNNAYSTGDFTLPSHASLFTGLYAEGHGAHRSAQDSVGAPLSSNAVTLTEVLAQKGYATAAVVSNYAYLTPGFGFSQGFDFFDYRSGRSLFSPLRECPSLRQMITFRLRAHFASRMTSLGYRGAEQITSQALEVVDELSKQDRPFFLFLNYMDAHTPRVPPQPYRDRFPGRDPNVRPSRYNLLATRMANQDRPLGESDRAHISASYDGAIAFLDAEVQVLLEQLKRSNILENTLLIITSDHGEMIGEHNSLDHGVGVYQEQIRVPLMIRTPPGDARGMRNAPASGVDIMPTILHAAGLNSPTGIVGQNLLDTDLPEARMVFSESFPRPHRLRAETAVVSSRWKLIESTKGKLELYDLAADPREQNNVAASHPELVAAMEPEMAKLAPSTKLGRSPRSVDAETLRKLRSLGYAGK